MSTTTADLTSVLQKNFPGITSRESLDHEAINVPITDTLAVLKTLRDDHFFDLLVDVTAIDWAEEADPRFVVVYHLYSTEQHGYFRVVTACAGDEENPVAPSVTSLWAGADWHERETYDMFGIKFEGHPDLRRILMWEGYPHYPLRKEFPLAGFETVLPDPEVAAETGTRVLPAPMMGGPFVASTGEMNMTDAEPQAKDESWNESNEKPEA